MHRVALDPGQRALDLLPQSRCGSRGGGATPASAAASHAPSSGNLVASAGAFSTSDASACTSASANVRRPSRAARDTRCAGRASPRFACRARASHGSSRRRRCASARATLRPRDSPRQTMPRHTARGSPRTRHAPRRPAMHRRPASRLHRSSGRCSPPDARARTRLRARHRRSSDRRDDNPPRRPRALQRRDQAVHVGPPLRRPSDVARAAARASPRAARLRLRAAASEHPSSSRALRTASVGIGHGDSPNSASHADRHSAN